VKVLVTGGAGFVGSVICEELLTKGHEVVVLDNLQQGHQQAVPERAEFVLADICDLATLDEIFQRFEVDAVIHMAAESVVQYSATDPKRFFQTNVVGALNLLNAMLRSGVDRLIFSSTAAVYGEPRAVPIDEEHIKNPVNAYGESKLMFERIIEWYAEAYGLKHVSLRYFNAAGASKRMGEDHNPETHLIPNVLKAALNNSPVSVFGTDYPTKDGTCLRDYVHVLDITGAHVLALERLDSLGSRSYNLGNGGGYSVTEVIEAAKRVTGVNIPVKLCPRRAGDPAVLVASSRRARSELGWVPEFAELESMVESAWEWTKRHPQGYADDH